MHINKVQHRKERDIIFHGKPLIGKNRREVELHYISQEGITGIPRVYQIKIRTELGSEFRVQKFGVEKGAQFEKDPFLVGGGLLILD